MLVVVARANGAQWILVWHGPGKHSKVGCGASELAARRRSFPIVEMFNSLQYKGRTGPSLLWSNWSNTLIKSEERFGHREDGC